MIVAIPNTFSAGMHTGATSEKNHLFRGAYMVKKMLFYKEISFYPGSSAPPKLHVDPPLTMSTHGISMSAPDL
jgi:hypothetical protein